MDPMGHDIDHSESKQVTIAKDGKFR
jgi:hypothetical protein